MTTRVIYPFSMLLFRNRSFCDVILRYDTDAENAKHNADRDFQRDNPAYHVEDVHHVTSMPSYEHEVM
jgi:hypothetical protein